MKILLVCVAVFLALVPIAVAAGKWLERVNQEFEEAENPQDE